MFNFIVDGKDHSECCDKRGIKPYCQTFCQGSTPDLSDIASLLTCVDEATDIMECIEQGRSKNTNSISYSFVLLENCPLFGIYIVMSFISYYAVWLWTIVKTRNTLIYTLINTTLICELEDFLGVSYKNFDFAISYILRWMSTLKYNLL